VSQMFLAVFTAEMMCKIITQGLVLGSTAYLRDSVRLACTQPPSPFHFISTATRR
jgi:hypothetical protein